MPASPSTPSPTMAAGSLPIVNIASGTQGGPDEAGTRVIRTEFEFRQLWSSIGAPPTARPAVDFSTTMVLAVFMGRKSTGGYGVRIDRVVPTESGGAVFVSEKVPGPGDTVTQALTSPFHIISCPVISGSLEFIFFQTKK